MGAITPMMLPSVSFLIGDLRSDFRPNLNLWSLVHYATGLYWERWVQDVPAPQRLRP